MPSECTLPALLAGIGDARIRHRMEVCQQGILQLDSLRQQHTKLMEQLRCQYPDFVAPPPRSTTTTAEPSHNASTLPSIRESPSRNIGYESTTLPPTTSTAASASAASTSLPLAMNAAFATRCESPMSACVSHRSSVSIDSGYTSISSDPFLSISTTPMSYSAFRKKASTLERPPHVPGVSTENSASTTTKPCNQSNEDGVRGESTSDKLIKTIIESTTDGVAPMRQNRFGRKKIETWQERPRSMYAAMIASSNEGEDKSGDIKDKERESFAGVCVAATARKLLDNSTLSQQGNPPPMSRKFATLQKTSPPKPLPRSIYPTSQPPPPPSARTLSASSSALHEPPPTSSSLPLSSSVSSATRIGFVNRPPPQFAKLDTSNHRQNAKVYAPIQNPPRLAPSATSAFTPKNPSLKPGSTPPTKPRGNCSSAHPSRAFIVPILASAKEIIPPRHHRVGIAPSLNDPNTTLHSAQPAAVLSRQQSYETNSLTANSPLEIRKMFISTPHTISRYGASNNNNSTCGQNVNRCAFDNSQICSQQSQSTPRNRREKIWHESEGL